MKKSIINEMVKDDLSNRNKGYGRLLPNWIMIKLMTHLWYNEKEKYEKRIKQFYSKSNRKYEYTFKNKGELDIQVVSNSHCYTFGEIFN